MDAHVIAARLLPLLDVTRLSEDDTPSAIAMWCEAVRASPVAPAAICVWPEHVTTARRALHATGIRVACVINFPDGGDDRERVLREARRAMAAGAEEIDLVFPYAAFLRGEVARAQAIVDAACTVCSSRVTLKLILETGELQSPEAIRAAAEIGVAAGVDFLKTSTGRGAQGATPEAVDILLDVIAAWNPQCGIKVSGGIRTPQEAATYVRAAERRMGVGWVDPSHFRIGSSGLFERLAVTAAPSLRSIRVLRSAHRAAG